MSHIPDGGCVYHGTYDSFESLEAYQKALDYVLTLFSDKNDFRCDLRGLVIRKGEYNINNRLVISMDYDHVNTLENRLFFYPPLNQHEKLRLQHQYEQECTNSRIMSLCGEIENLKKQLQKYSFVQSKSSQDTVTANAILPVYL